MIEKILRLICKLRGHHTYEEIKKYKYRCKVCDDIHEENHTEWKKEK